MIPLPRLAIKARHSTNVLRFDLSPLQLGLGGCPWRVAVCSILLVRTRVTQVVRVAPELFDQYPTPMELAEAPRGKLAELVGPLGLQYSRAKTLVRFSTRFLEDAWTDMRDLPGVGPYVSDAVGLVCFGCTELESGDAALTSYARRLQCASGSSATA